MRTQFPLPFDVPSGSKVLLLGVGGGYDVVCTVPVAAALELRGCEVHFASYSTSDLSGLTGARAVPAHPVPVGPPAVEGQASSCPEEALARWRSAVTGRSEVIWSFDRPGVRSMAAGLDWLHRKLELDAMVLVDGGVDGLFIGTEFDTATPSMDAVSIISAHLSSIPRKIYGFTAFGTEGVGYEVRHADALERISELMRAGAMLGASAILRTSVAGAAFLDAIERIGDDVGALKQSIITSSIGAAMLGAFGEKRLTPRNDVTPVWVSPLTALYWFFELDAVAKAKPYLDDVVDTDDLLAVAEAIERARARHGAVARRDIPI